MEKAKKTLENLQEVSLNDEGNLLRVLIDHVPDFIYIKDTRSRFVLANQKIAQVNHLKSPDEIIGKSDHDFYPAEMADKYFRDEQEILATGIPMINQEEKSLDEKGNDIFLSTTKIPLKDKQGNVVGLVGIGRDITHLIRAEALLVERSEQLENVNMLLEEKQEEILQQSEELMVQTESLTRANTELQKLSIAVSETDNVVIIMDAEGNFEWVNKSFTRIYGHSLEEWKKKRGSNLLSGSFNPYIKDIFEKCLKVRETVRYQSEAKNKDGQTIWTQSTLSPVLDSEGNVLRLVTIDSDITTVKKAQELIEAQRLELENQRDQLEKLNVTKDKFFSIIAHDLKNPFHSILGFTSLLKDNYTDIEDDKKREYLGMVHDSAQSAQDLLENLLNWSRAQSGTIKYSPAVLDLYDLIRETHQILHASIEKKGLIFDNLVPEGSLVSADRNMIQTVLRNLISNAMKYTPEKGHITISTKPIKDSIQVSVSDTGIGIPEERQKKILEFGEFYSSPGTAGEQGTGLGLIVCKDFIKKHGGELGIESREGKGTTFTFTLHKNKNKEI